MRISKGFLIGGLVSVIGVVWLWSYGCEERVTQPWPPPEPPKDYVAYFYDALSNEGNWYFAYHPLTNNIDSFYLPYESTPVISADGKKMYVRDGAHDAIAVVELDSFTVVDQLPYGAPLAVSPDNQLIAVYSDGLYILRTSDYSEVFRDTTLGGRGVFSSNSKSFYGTTGWSPGPPDPFAYRVDLADTLSPVTKKTFPDGGPLQLVPSLDEKKWFLYLKFDTFGCLFAVYDILTDSIIFRDHLTPGTGDLELTPNGRYVFYTNPGTLLIGPPPPFSFTAYDVDKNEIHKVISTIGVFDEPHDIGVPVGEICITPDGRWLVAIMTGGYDYVFALDIENMNIDRYRLVYGPMLYGLACQNSP